jgi:hypothetical protein
MNLTTIRPFADACERLGLAVPEPITQGLRLVEVARAHVAMPTGGLLDMSDDELRERITATAIRHHDGGRGNTLGMQSAIVAVSDQIADEVRSATLPYLEQMIIDLQPRFDELTAPLVGAAQRHGITYATTSDAAIDRGDDFIAAYRAGKKAWLAVQPIASFRKLISTTFGLPPIGSHGADMSVLYAAGDNWGHNARYYLEGRTTSHLDWYKLAAGGLHLNTLSEVHEKIRERQAAEFAAAHPRAPHATPEVAVNALLVDDDAPMPSYPRG